LKGEAGDSKITESLRTKGLAMKLDPLPESEIADFRAHFYGDLPDELLADAGADGKNALSGYKYWKSLNEGQEGNNGRAIRIT